MKTFPYQTFASLCEAYIAEVSTSLNLVKQQPGGDAVIKYLHSKQGLSHDQSYRPVDKISWSDLKGSYRGAWVIIIGQKGVGAIRASGGTTGSYEAIAVDPSGELRHLNDSRGGNILDFFKPLLGKFNKYYVGSNTTAVKDKQKQRDWNQSSPASQVDKTTIIKKFKPLWVKAMTAALADVKGMAQTMIKNDSYDKAEKKLSLCRSLENAIDAVESGDTDIPGIIGKAVNSGILMAASHHYPEETGEINRGRYGGDLSTERQEGPQKLLADIAGGDTAKLGTILSFFKRSLMTS